MFYYDKIALKVEQFLEKKKKKLPWKNGVRMANFSAEILQKLQQAGPLNG